jgi:hypothetical protein
LGALDLSDGGLPSDIGEIHLVLEFHLVCPLCSLDFDFQMSPFSHKGLMGKTVNIISSPTSSF